MQLSRVSQHANSDVAANQHAEALDYQGELFYSETMRQMFQGGKKRERQEQGSQSSSQSRDLLFKYRRT